MVDCQTSSLLLTVLCCLIALVSRTSSLSVEGGSLLEVLSLWWLSSSRNAARPSRRYCRLASRRPGHSVFSATFLAPPSLSVAVSLSLTIHCSLGSCLCTFGTLDRSLFRPSICTSGLSHLALFCVLWLLFLHDGTVPLVLHWPLSLSRLGGLSSSPHTSCAEISLSGGLSPTPCFICSPLPFRAGTFIYISEI